MRNELLDKISQFEDYSDLHRKGFSISEIRSAVKDTLAPFLRSQEILQSEMVYHLAGEAINIRRISQAPAGLDFLRRILDSYWNAYHANADACTSVIAEMEQSIEGGKRKFISIALLERDKDGMDTEILAHEVFQMIGSTIEGPIRPYLNELLSLFHLHDKTYIPESTTKMTLGEVVTALQLKLTGTFFLQPGNYGVSLNQWRNIAQHLSFTVVDDQIKATYGRRNTKSVVLAREDLIHLLRQIALCLAVLKAARVIFAWDHASEIRAKLKDMTEHPDSVLVDLSATFLTQGFRICRTDAGKDSLRLVVEDLRAEYENPNFRAIHASQFLAMVACRVPGKSLTIEYIDPHRGRSCEFSITVSDAEVVRESDDPLKELALRFTFKKEPNTWDSRERKSAP